MKKAPYSHIFYICITVIAFAVLLTGIVIINMSAKAYKQQKFDEISNVSELYISDIQGEFAVSNSFGSENMKKLSYRFNTCYGINFSIYSSNGMSIISYDSQERTTLSDDIRNRLDKSYYIELESGEVSETQPLICYGNSFYVQYNNNEPQKYYLMAYSPSNSLDDFSQNLITIFTIIFTIVFAICAIIFLFMIKSLNKPILEIKRIAKNYAKGDFSERLPQTENQDFKSIYTSLNKMADFISSNEETSKSFIANVSHELRTPMTTIGGFVDGILDGIIPKPKHTEYLHLVSQEIKRLRILVSSMLNMTKFESGTMKPNFRETNVTELIIKTVFMFEQKLENKKIDVQGLDADRMVIVADPDLIEQVIYNLIENAVKFVNEEGVISFDFQMNENDCQIGIQNTGEGLTNTEISQVFDRFYKTDSSRGKDTTGLGLGLSISRKIIQLHDGQIMVKSVHGEYTKFIIQLPIKQK